MNIIMKFVKIIDHTGRELEGEWNRKIYMSNKGADLHRVYIDGEELHISEDQLQSISNSPEEAKDNLRKRISEDTKSQIQSKLEKLTPKDKFELSREIIKDMQENGPQSEIPFPKRKCYMEYCTIMNQSRYHPHYEIKKDENTEIDS